MLEVKDGSLSIAGINNTFGTITVSGGDLSGDSSISISVNGGIIGSGGTVTNQGILGVNNIGIVAWPNFSLEDYNISDVEDDDNQTAKKQSIKLLL